MAPLGSRFDDPEHAVARILEGWARAFAELGVSKAGMKEIAAYSGCSPTPARTKPKSAP